MKVKRSTKETAIADMEAVRAGLVQRLKAGDRGAGELLVEENYRPIYRWFLWMSNNSGLAADLTQDTFVAVWESLDRFRDGMPLPPWLFGIARNIWRKHCAHNSKNVMIDDQNIEHLPDPASRPEKALLSREAGRALEEAVAELPDDYKEILVLRFWEDLDYSDIAQALAISEGLARWRVHRGRKLLLEKLQRAGVMEEAFIRAGGKLGWWLRMHERPSPPPDLRQRCLATLQMPGKPGFEQQKLAEMKDARQPAEVKPMMKQKQPEPVRVAALDELKQKGYMVVSLDVPVVVFYYEDDVFALDNRCPHMGFPLHRGTIHDGILTCWWHHYRFDLSSGCTFDLPADDAPTYPVEIREGEVWLLPRAARDEVAYWRTRLKEGMQHQIELVMAKAIIVLLQQGVDDRAIVRQAALFGTCYREVWGAGMTILAAMANLLPYLSEEEKFLALWSGVRNMGDDTAKESPHWEFRPLETEDLSLSRLKQWLRQWTRVRHEEGAERTLLTAIVNGATPDELADLLFSTATDRIYCRNGEVLDFSNKAIEILDAIGWEHAAEVLPTLVAPLVWARGGEESTEWRQPFDLVPLLDQVAEELPVLLTAGEKERETDREGSAPDDLVAVLLGDDPVAIVHILKASIRAGTPVQQLSKLVAYAAALRICRFGTSNEFVDWDTVLHTFTYCNAVHQALKRKQSPEVVRGLFHGALSIYLDRFLNVPPTPLPGERDNLDEEPLEANALRQKFLDTLDRKGQVNQAGRITARYLSLGHPVEPFICTLTHAVVREDARLHIYQVLEAAVRQYEEWGNSKEGHHILIAASRFIAAHSPTERQNLQTAQIAKRLLRGETLYE
jgi:RNA polymerase sigma factor (sigma-70 family)